MTTIPKPYRKRSIFMAYAWSALNKLEFKHISDLLIKNNWNVFAGVQHNTLPTLEGKIENFRTQNLHLFNKFVRNIKRSDIFIADITGLNPNVLIELGIAIEENKNVLIISGESLSKLPFDISGLEIHEYKTREALSEIIFKYLNDYLSIKEVGFDSLYIKNLVYTSQSEIINSSEESISLGNNVNAYRITPLIGVVLPRMKDVKISCEFRINKYFHETDWFGFILRSTKENRGRYEPILNGSILVNARYNGKTAITIYPGETEVISKEIHGQNVSTFRQLLIELEGGYIKVSGDKGKLEYELLENTQFGYLYLACYRADVEIRNIKILRNDTTSEI